MSTRYGPCNQENVVQLAPPPAKPGAAEARINTRLALQDLGNNRTKTTKPTTQKTTAAVQKNAITAKRSDPKAESVYDPDENTRNDPFAAPEYVVDIFKYLRELESKYPIHEGFLTDHETSPKHRMKLVNWLIEVHHIFSLHLETLYVCIQMTDRYLQEMKNVGTSTLQLVGATALFVACKYEESYCPNIQDFVYICDDVFSTKRFFKMEVDILKTLDFNLGKPTGIQFLRRYSKVGQVKSDHHCYGKFFLEIMLTQYCFCHVPPSLQAAASICLAIAVVNGTVEISKVWTPTLSHYSAYKYSEIRPILIDLAQVIMAPKITYEAVQKKYSATKYTRLSLDITKLKNCPSIRKLAITRK